MTKLMPTAYKTFWLGLKNLLMFLELVGIEKVELTLFASYMNAIEHPEQQLPYQETDIETPNVA